ncbi:MAG: branched-chain amino acid ABC transporter permease [Nitrospirae bacterium]|nr:branched-chain amino acid ABC transporter permease [Nitrospirota bacterium]
MNNAFIKTLLRAGGISLWSALLFLPFKGLQAAGVLCILMFLALLVVTMASRLSDPFSRAAEIVRKNVAGLMPGDPRYLLLLILPALTVPFFSRNYVLDVAVLAGIYMILALALNVVVGFTGLLNLGFVAYYAIGAYSFALLNTRLGLGFWSALPLSVVITTAAGFLFAAPALRLKGDYLALVTLGFGEIVRITLNNWDSFTKGPNGISGIAAPFFFGTSLAPLSSFYYLVLFFVVLSVIVIRRVHASKIGRAWIALREDEIAASAMGIRITRYKLYSVSFGAFWAGLAGCLFAAKMQFISPESFTFMESVLILSMVILGGLGSIAGVIVGAVILVALPEALRDIQMYRMLALGAGVVLLMIFRPQGLFGGHSAPRS